MHFRLRSSVAVAVLIAVFLSLYELEGHPVQEAEVTTDKNDAPRNRTNLTSKMLTAVSIHQYINESSDPCTDFYSFACGNWKTLYPASAPDNVYTGRFQQIASEYARKRLRLLQNRDDPKDNDIDVKVKDFYESCTKFVNLTTDDEYRKQLLQLISESGEMPALIGDAWNATNFDWLETVAQIAHKYGTSIIVQLLIMPDLVMNTENRIYIVNADLHLESRSMYTDEETAVYRQEYKNEVAKRLRSYLGLADELAQKVANETVEFEVSLGHGLVDDKMVESVLELSELTTAKAMVEKYGPTLNIDKLINITFGEVVNDPIYEYSEAYQRNLVEVIQSTPKHIVANYIMYTFLNAFLMNITEAQLATEWFCLEKTKKYFAKNVDNMIHRRYNTSVSEQDVHSIWENLKLAFSEELQSQRMTWISAETRKKALEKLKAIKMEINSYETSNFSEEFGDLIIRKNDFIGNIKNILEIRARRKLADLHEKPKQYEAAETLSFTPANILIENTVKVPLMILQSNYFWGLTYPNALKYGALGSLLAHELMHGFDDTGRKYDNNGNSINWWDAESSDAFEQRKQCFVEQSSNYSIGGRLLPRSPLQSENIADHAAVRIAYASYLRWLEHAAQSDLDAELLPFMKYTNKQLFFISFAQIWCSDTHPSVVNKLIATDIHLPSQFRANGPLSNFPEFGKEFNCTKDSPMNGHENTRCEIY